MDNYHRQGRTVDPLNILNVESGSLGAIFRVDHIRLNRC